MVNKNMTLDDVESIDDLPLIKIVSNSEILVSMNIDGVDIFREIGISRDLTKRILDEISYGSIGWEEYNILINDN